jgi:tetratricopeptide (TPR) repeat protein
LYADLGCSDEAEELYRQVRESWKKSRAVLASPLCAYLDSYADFLARMKRSREERELRLQIRYWRPAHALRYALSIALVLVAASYTLVCARLWSSIVTARRGPFEPVRSHVDQLANIEQAVLGARAAADVYSDYAGIHRGWEAEEGFDAGREHQEEAYWALHRALCYVPQASSRRSGWLACVLGDLADIELSRGNLQEASRLYRESLEIMPASWGRADMTSGRKKLDALLALGTINQTTRHFGESERYYRQASLFAAEVWGRDSELYIDALVGLAEAKLQQGDLSAADKLLDDAVQRQEKIVQQAFGLLGRPQRDVERLVRILLKRAETLRLTGRTKEAERVIRHIDEIQARLRPWIDLDAEMQARILQLVKDTTGRLLSLKYHARNAPEAGKGLSETLTAYALSGLGRIPWCPKDVNAVRAYEADSSAPDAVNVELEQISVTSPDNMGFLTVGAQGRCQLVKREESVGERQFSFVYKVRLPQKSGEQMTIQEVTETGSDAE